MNRALILGLLLVGSSAAAQDYFSDEVRTSPTPAWLPRGVMLGVGIAQDTVYVPTARLHWAFTLTQQRVDALIGVFELGGSHGVSFTDRAGLYYRSTITALDHAVALIGVGYRGDRGKWNWGLHVTGGPLLYRATYLQTGETATDLPDESKVIGWLEGRVQLGYRVTPAVAVGIAAAFGSGLGAPRAAYAYDSLNGWTFGLYADWR